MGTFSMVARCPKTGALGVCVSTATLAVGSVVPHVEANVGAIATQGYTNIKYGVKGLKLLRLGLSPKTALEALLKDDSQRDLRQVIIIDKYGRKAAHTGMRTSEWRGHIIGEDYVAAGNMLSSSRVIEAMAEAFESSAGWLADRLMQALEAGDAAGGDIRGKLSAALLVVGGIAMPETRPILDLRVDMHKDPVKELRRIFEAYKIWLRLR